ncbi:MAG: hypothetical protein Q8K85_18880 [Hyphomicrobium sp.]|nr:hypothetical protein [Hyphomicrobium sp.]
MGVKRDSNCPLCGAQLTAAELLDAGGELIDAELGVVETHCPHCQGYLEVLPANGRVDLGYRVGASGERFDVALSLPFEGFVVEHAQTPPRLVLTAPGRYWEFGE